MDEFWAKLHRTWVELLYQANYREVAALVIDGCLEPIHGDWQATGVFVDVPPSSFAYIEADDHLRVIIESTLKSLLAGHMFDQNSRQIPKDSIDVQIRVKLLEVEDDWRDRLRELIVQAKDTNQAVVTEKVFAREKKQVLTYNEMKFGSQSEIRIAQDLERRHVLFFPLPLAVRHDTGNFYSDHREADFVICQDGVWGILEVAHHPDRYEKDSEKDVWFKKSGILCVQNYTAERCYNHATEVVAEFLGILAKHKR